MTDVRNSLNPRRTLTSRLESTFFPRLFLFLLAFVVLAGTTFAQTFTTLYSFGAKPTDGIAPPAGVIIDRNGKLFGTAAVGGILGSNGNVFELIPPAVTGDPWTEKIIHQFRGTPDGKIAESRLVMTSSGALMGTTDRGGSLDQGSIYMLLPSSSGGAWKERILHSFGTTPGDVVTPNLGFFNAPEGLYGADQAGANSTGAIYLLTPPHGGSSWTQTILYTFKPRGSGDGVAPGGEMVRDSLGNFYGVTILGGVNDMGAVYELSPPASQGGQWTETILYSFSGTDGSLPAGPLLIGPNGVLYGTASGGGANGAGNVFQLNPPAVPGGAWTETVPYAFSGGLDGTNPSKGVIADKQGRLFGSASSSIFMLTPPQNPSDPWTETVLHNFTGPDGFVAVTPLTMNKHSLYGTTQQGGAFGTGTVFQITIP